MASATLTTSAFPAGTTVDIFPVSGRSTLDGAPTGPKIGTATVDSETRLFVDGLEPQTAYYAVAQVAARWIWVQFFADPEAAVVGPTPVDLSDFIRYSTAQLGFSSSQIGFFGRTPIARPGPYAISNVTTRRTLDADAATVEQLADLLATLHADLEQLGLVG